MSGATIQVPHRGILTACIMTANVMQSLDSTIANVALPYMQGSLSASYDQITWVLTSYVVAAAIMTAPVGWMAARFGRKNLHVGALLGFLISSMLCGASQSLGQIVIFRILQGMCGAALIPLAQATMLDIYPFEQRAQAMAVFGTGVMLGPIMGPTLGGLLTDAYNWRWVFYVNLPVGIVAITGLSIFLPKAPPKPDMRFDWTGFAVLALGIGSFQMMLDRGQTQDWFNSSEIIIEAVLAGLGLYLFLVHLLTHDRPFIPREVFKDRNFCTAVFMMFFVGMVLLASSALLAPYLQTLGNYPVYTAGITMAPRGFGTMAAMLLAGRVIGSRIDQRKMVAFGLCLLSLAMYNMSQWTPDVPQGELIANLLMQGFSVGIIFNPMQVLAFTTLAPRLRGAATPMMSLFRNLGSAIGVSVTQATLAHNTQVSHADLAAMASPFNRMLQDHAAVAHYLSPVATHGAELLDEVINRQAQIIAYSDDYKMMSFVALPPLILLFLLRRYHPATASTSPPLVSADARAAGAAD
jgi:DHA2 family multidrug resistance protein